MKLAAGNPGKRAINGSEPEPAKLLDISPPAHLPQAVAAVWQQLAPQLSRAGLLTELDTIPLEMACDAIAQFRLAMENTKDGRVLIKNAETGSVSLSPWTLLSSMSTKRAMAILTQFGVTPAARSKVMVNPQADLFEKPKTGPDRYFQ